MSKKKVNRQRKLRRKIEDYKPYKGFYDLRNYKLPVRLFKKLWKIQETLFFINNKKEYYQEFHPIQWRKAQELSADYQRILFSK